jgi:hypothetical protein
MTESENQHDASVHDDHDSFRHRLLEELELQDSAKSLILTASVLSALSLALFWSDQILNFVNLVVLKVSTTITINAFIMY